MKAHIPDRLLSRNILSLFLLSVLLSSCISNIEFPLENPEQEQNSTVLVDKTLENNPKQAVVEFLVQVPVNTPDEPVFLDILDEVTGLSLNPTRYPMEKLGQFRYYARLPISIGTVIKYRYAFGNNSISIEHDNQGKQVRYRLLHVQNPIQMSDIVSCWSNILSDGPTGRVHGTITDIRGLPVPNIMVTAGGKQVLSASDGTFYIEQLPIGTHNVVAYSLNGSYEIFQQGAIIAEQATTPVLISLSPTRLVNVTFIVKTPNDLMQGYPVRLIGNLYSLGNTFADLNGGVSVVSNRAPLMSGLPDGRYFVTIPLPVGFDLNYKYTLGDGFWNSEQSSNALFVQRSLTVPDAELTIEDNVEAWQNIGIGSITFKVKVPETTPVQDQVSIQFNPYTWTEPVPMWPLGNNVWEFVLNSPQHLLGDISYRFCRNNICQSEISGIISSSSEPTIQTTEIIEWEKFSSNITHPSIVASNISQRNSDFIAGIQYVPEYYPSWQSYYHNAFLAANNLNANWVILPINWNISSSNPMMIEQKTGEAALWDDIIQLSEWNNLNGNNLTLYPGLFDNSELVWQTIGNDHGKWDLWFDQYRRFVLHHADLSQQIQSKALIIGDVNIQSASKNEYLSNKWLELISDIRSRFSGELIWSQNISNTEDALIPDFVEQMDGIYFVFSAPFSDSNELSQEKVKEVFSNWLKNRVEPLGYSNEKKIIIGIEYPSNDKAAAGCFAESSNCNNITDSPVIDLKLQETIYQGCLSTIEQFDWIDGFVSVGFNPLADIHDASSSIRGKTAADYVWYWYKGFLGK
ncbi:MAG: hypothetical protein JEZ03_06875 [Bacteroidales bacterium]|nr:hypothetical protein [Bacteroidales bacterium]